MGPGFMYSANAFISSCDWAERLPEISIPATIIKRKFIFFINKILELKGKKYSKSPNKITRNFT
jgi:hypothetical protein